MVQTSVIIVNYNGSAVVGECLDGLLVQSYRDFEVIVVDNGSTDESLRIIGEFRENCREAFPLHVVQAGRNLGFSGGNNEGLRHAKGEYIALFNNDARPEAACLGSLVKVMDDMPGVGICASKMIASGTGLIDSAGDGFSSALRGFKRGEGEDAGKYAEEGDVFGACAGAALYRRKMIEDIGFFDEDFFLIHEDTDLNCRARLAGWKVRYVPAAVTHHKVRSTIGHMSRMSVYYSLRNSEFVRMKNVPFPVLLLCIPEFVAAIFFEFLYFAVRHGMPGVYIKAKLDALRKTGAMFRKRRAMFRETMKVRSGDFYGLITPVWNREFFLAKIRKLVRG